MCSLWNKSPMSPVRNGKNSPNILNSTELSQDHTTGMPSVFPIASPERLIITFKDDSNEPTMPSGLRWQLPIIPPSLNDLNLRPNPFNILATAATVNHTEDGNDNNYRLQSPEPTEPSPISTPPMNVSTIDSWEPSHTTTDDNTFYFEVNPAKYIFFHQLLPRRQRPES